MTKHHLSYCIIGLLLLWGNSYMMKAQNNPYVDDKLFHYGFSLGVAYLSYGVTEADSLVQMEKQGTVYHARTSAPGFLVTAGFVADLRLTRHLNLRFCPSFGFGMRTITYMNYSIPTEEIKGQLCLNNQPNIQTLPISIPFYLKWSAEREVNYRPYLIAGGGVTYDVQTHAEDVLSPKPFDYFVEVGLGCDFYLRWFKLCPEIKYRLGFKNVLTPIPTNIDPANNNAWAIGAPDYFYTNSLSALRNQQISFIFNFE